MAKTYNTIPTVSTGDVYTATAHNNIVENSNNYRVPPMCINSRTGQSVNDATVTPIAFTSAASLDTDSMHDSATNNTRFTANTAGVYLVSATLVWTGGFTDVVASLTIRKGGSTTIASTDGFSNAYVNPGLAVSCLVSLAAAEYIEVTAYQDNVANTARTAAAKVFIAWQGQAS